MEYPFAFVVAGVFAFGTGGLASRKGYNAVL
jgi:hypothetical protein